MDNQRAQRVAPTVQVAPPRLLVMASLLVADELSDAYAELESFRSTDKNASARRDAENMIGSRIEKLTLRIEDIAKSLEES